MVNLTRQTLQDEGHEVVEANSVHKLEAWLSDNHYALILINADLMFGDVQEPMHCLFTKNVDKPIIVISVPSSNYRTIQETRTAFKLGARIAWTNRSGEQLLSLVRRLLSEFAIAASCSEGGSNMGYYRGRALVVDDQPVWGELF